MIYGPGRRKTLVGRGGAGRDALGKAAAHDLRAAAASFACRGLPGQENCSGRCANIAVRVGALTMRLWQELGHKGMEITANL